MKKNNMKRGAMIPQVFLAIVLALPTSTIHGQKYFDRLDANPNLEIRDYQGPKWDTSTNPYQFLQDLYEEHGLTFHSVTDECMFSDNAELFRDVAAAFSIPSWALKGVHSIGDILTRVLTIRYGNSSSEEADYFKIEYSSTPKDFLNYLKLYPQSSYHEIVIKKMYATQIAHLWNVAKLIDQEYYYKRCLQVYDLYSRQYCEDLLELDNESDCRLHYIRYEGYDHIALCLIAKQAKERLEELQIQVQKKEAEWRDACDSNNYAAYSAYHRKYLGSESADSALIRMQPFEEEGYRKAFQTNTRFAYESFLQKYPYGYYSTRASRNIVDLFQAVHHAVPDQMSFIATYESVRPLHAHVGIVNADKNKRTYTLTICGKCGFHTTLKPGETVWLDLPVAENYDVLVEADNGEYRFSTLYFNACGYTLCLYGDSPKWWDFQTHEDIGSKVNRQALRKLTQEASSECGEKIHYDFGTQPFQR